MSTEIREFPVVTLCGSSKFKDAFIDITKELSLAGAVVISLGLFGHADNLFDEEITPEIKAMLDSAHRQKIDMSDAIYVINVDDYIGASTSIEIEYARDKNKKIFLLEPSKHIPSGQPQFGDIYQWIAEFRRCSELYRQRRVCQKDYKLKVSLRGLIEYKILENYATEFSPSSTLTSIQVGTGNYTEEITPTEIVDYSPRHLFKINIPQEIADYKDLRKISDYIASFINPIPQRSALHNYLNWRVVKVTNVKNAIIICIIPFDSINSYEGLEIDLRENN